jgi:DnaJ domain
MGFYLLLGAVLLGVGLLAARSFTRASPARLAQGVRAFIAAFSALASTGLLFTGRFGLALITIGATFMAIRAMVRSSAGGVGQFGGSPGGGQQSSEVTTDTLSMQLDHATGELEGEVLRGRFAGRSLDSLGLAELLELLADCQREDPRSIALLETYLDRRQPDWRGHVGGGEQAQEPDQQAASSGTMDEATACSILGLSPGASADDIKAAHRRLMTKLHPDHGGSGYLAAQLNQAKDFLLRRRR